MNDMLKAAEEIRKFQRMFGAMISAAEQFEALGSLDQALAERKSQLAAAQREIDDAKAARGRIETEAANVLAEANANAKAMADASEKAAAQVAEKAKADAAAVLAEANTKAEAVCQEKVSVTQEIATLRKEREQLQQQVADAETRLKAAQDALAELRGKL